MFLYDCKDMISMDNRCYSCKQIFQPRSLKTSRSRFKIIGITPPEGMGVSDRICSSCLHKMYNEQIKQNDINQLKKNMVKDLTQFRKNQISSLPKKIEIEKNQKFLLK